MDTLIELQPAPEPIPDTLAAEAAAALGSAPEDPTLLPPGPDPAAYDPDRVTEWEPYTHLAVTLLANVGLPQWEITADEKHELTKSTAHVLEDLFPGGINGRFAPYFRLISVAGIICITRAQKHGGKLPGIGPKVEQPPADINAG